MGLSHDGRNVENLLSTWEMDEYKCRTPRLGAETFEDSRFSRTHLEDPMDISMGKQSDLRPRVNRTSRVTTLGSRQANPPSLAPLRADIRFLCPTSADSNIQSSRTIITLPPSVRHPRSRPFGRDKATTGSNGRGRTLCGMGQLPMGL